SNLSCAYRSNLGQLPALSRLLKNGLQWCTRSLISQLHVSSRQPHLVAASAAFTSGVETARSSASWGPHLDIAIERQVIPLRPDAPKPYGWLLISSRAPSCRVRRAILSRASSRRRSPRSAGRTDAAAR